MSFVIWSRAPGHPGGEVRPARRLRVPLGACPTQRRSLAVLFLSTPYMEDKTMRHTTPINPLDNTLLSGMTAE